MTNIFSIDLQLFATLNTNTTVASGSMGAGSVNTALSPEMKTFYDMTLIDMAGPQLVYDQFGQKRPIPKNGGKTIEFRKFSALPKATTPIQEGITPDGGTLEVTKIEATVEQFGYYIVQSDVLELTALDNTIIEATKLLGKQAGVTLDTIVRDILMTGLNVSYAGDVAGRSNVTENITVADVCKVVAKLRAANAPTINGEYVGIIHPYVAHDLMRDEEWIESHKYAQPENLYNGEIGKVAGVRFVQSSEAKCFGNGVFGCLFLGEGAYGVTEVTGGGLETIVKQKGSAGTADPLDQRSSIGWKAMKTAEILVPEYMVRYECKSSFGAVAAN
jgi:N4-gp56 family major capsid protein